MTVHFSGTPTLARPNLICSAKKVHYTELVLLFHYDKVRRSSTTHDGEDTLSRSIMVYLNEGDVIYAGTAHETFSTFPTYETSLTGFMYSPVHETPVSI